METFDVRLLKRSIGRKRLHSSIRPLYADHSWTKELDIVNELGGHTGCVNALRYICQSYAVHGLSTDIFTVGQRAASFWPQVPTIHT